MVTNTDLRRWFLAFSATLCAVLLPLGMLGVSLTAQETLGKNAQVFEEHLGVESIQNIITVAKDSGLWSAVIYVFPYVTVVVGYFSVVAHLISEIFV